MAFIKNIIVRIIKKRILKSVQAYGDYEHATSFVINAPLSEWRSRLWLVENISQPDGERCTDEAVYRWLTRR